METILQSFFLVCVGFLAGIINTLAGGGSLFTLPVLILMGLPPTVANGTNRIAIIIQSLSGTMGYKSKGINSFPFNIYLGVSSGIGALIGAYLAIHFDEILFNKVLAFIMILFGTLIFFRKKNLKLELVERLEGKYLFWTIFGFFFIGIYGGFINAGIGIVIMLILNRYNNMTLVKTNATKVTVVLIYSLVAFVIFVKNGAVDWKYGIQLSFGTFVGAWFASRWSVRKGDNVIRFVLIISVSLMSIKLWFS